MTTCIFCNSEFTASGEGEHIIPDSIGGIITIPGVCTACNSKMNSLYDNKFTQEELIKAARQAYGIESRKRDKVKCFLDKPGELHGNKVILDESGKPVVLSNFSCEALEDGRFVVNGVVDKSNIADVIKYLDRNAKKMFSTLHPGDTEEQLEEKVRNLKKQVIDYCNDDGNITSSNDSISYKIQISLDIVKKEYCKIAYEFGFYKLGHRYLADPCGSLLRDCLNSNSMFDDIPAQILGKLPFNTSQDKHYIAIVGNCCIISIFGVHGVVPISLDASNFVEERDAMMTIIDPREGSYTEVRFVDFISVSKNTDEGD